MHRDWRADEFSGDFERVPSPVIIELMIGR